MINWNKILVHRNETFKGEKILFSFGPLTSYTALRRGIRKGYCFFQG